MSREGDPTRLSELEIRKESEYAEDHLARRVGLLAALIATVLAIVTIASHRAHTSAVLAKAESSDQWAFYQAKSLKRNTAALGAELASLSNAAAAPVVQRFRADAERYENEARPIERQAEASERESLRQEHRALRFDIGEGLLELGLVLCSLYFISKRHVFPLAGVISALAGALTALTGFFS